MTYKKLLGIAIENDAAKWVAKVMDKNDIKHELCVGYLKDMYFDDETLLYDVTVTIDRHDARGNLYETEVVVGGAMNEVSGEFNHSVIWDSNHKIIWMSVRETREEMGITELRIA